MSKELHTSQALQEAIIHLADLENCRTFMVDLRSPTGEVKCPCCGSNDVSWLPNARVYKCYAKPLHALAKVSLRVGTIFEDSPLPLQSGSLGCGWS
jgi:hypothetical protein